MHRAARIQGEWRALICLAATLAAAPQLACAGGRAANGDVVRLAAGPRPLALQSRDIAPGGRIAPNQVYDASGCRGGNASPALSWAHAPAGTRSFAVLMLDPDAPGGAWWHWAVFDIPAGVTALRTGAGNPGSHLLPRGAIQARNDFGSPGYAGPCPPAGPPHHYLLTLYALRVPKLGLSADATPAQVASEARASALAEAQIMAIYGR